MPMASSTISPGLSWMASWVNAMKISPLNLELLRRFLDYDAETGLITKKSNGKVLSAINLSGYIDVSIQSGKDKIRQYGHRLAWALHHNVSEFGYIDHINGVKSDNRISNLREVSMSVNQQNRRGAQANSNSGLIGVHTLSRGRGYSATIKANGKSQYLGFFKDPVKAHEAYISAKRALHVGNTL